MSALQSTVRTNSISQVFFGIFKFIIRSEFSAKFLNELVFVMVGWYIENRVPFYGTLAVYDRSTNENIHDMGFD